MNPTTEAQTPAPYKPYAFTLLWLALIAQAIWMGLQHFSLHESWSSMSYPLMYAAPFLFLAATYGRVRWIASLLRLPVAAAFLDAVADRLGLLGPPGAPGVGWGDFSHFIAYTATVNSFMPHAVIPVLAILATIGETTFGIGLLLGVRLRIVATGSAVLLFLFATAMIISGFSQFAYGVYLMAAGTLALSTADASLCSVDAILRKQKIKMLRPQQLTLNETAQPEN
ncbi:MAG TPA: DoxX family protein [Edaphobacter sp.]|nr:DoxX family protein [Edaphobacter sp.]